MSLAIPQPGPKYDAQNEAQARTQVSQAVTQLQADVVKLKTITAVTFANLPASPRPFQRAFVTDASVTTYASNVAGGGTNIVPVFWNQTSGHWVIG